MTKPTCLTLFKIKTFQFQTDAVKNADTLSFIFNVDMLCMQVDTYTYT